MIYSLLLTFSLASDSCKNADQAETECCFISTGRELSRLTRIQTKDGKFCTLSLFSTDSSKSFRRFGFGSDGNFSIYLKPGGDAVKSGAMQNFFFFPAGELPTVRNETGKPFQIKSGSGMVWTINPKTATPISVTGCEIAVSPSFSQTDSGVRIKSCEKHLVMETRVEAGGEWIAYPEKTSVIKDPKGIQCEIKHRDLFTFKEGFQDKKGRSFEQNYKFKNNKDLGQMLKAKCPSLDISMLNSAPAENRVRSEEQRALDLLEGRH